MVFLDPSLDHIPDLYFSLENVLHGRCRKTFYM
jgi:hypothetical protein